MRVRPSYHNGFARSAAESAHPELWRGLVGAWCPALGPTGSTLLDWSNKKRHGTTSNMDLATGWSLNDGQYALDFDGSNDNVNLPESIDAGIVNTLSFWIRPTSLRVEIPIGEADYSFDYLLLLHSNGSIFYRINAVSVSWTHGLTMGEWNHATFVRRGDTVDYHLNGGISQGQKTGLGTSNSTLFDKFGAESDGANSNPFDGMLDDIRCYNRALLPGELQLLARRRGIAYERRARTAYSIPAAAGGPFRMVGVGGGLIGQGGGMIGW